MSPASPMRDAEARSLPIPAENGRSNPQAPRRRRADKIESTPGGSTRSELLRALNAGEFGPYLQPQVDLRTNRVVGVEALVRWTRPGYGTCPPASFLPALERFGLMRRLTDVMLDGALRWSSERRRLGAEPLAVSVNVSGPTLDEGFVSRVDIALERWHVPPQGLTVEITETGIMENAAATVELLGRLKSLGVQLSIDDFGTGYSSLARLHRLPIDEIKIDRAFVRDLREGADRGMVRAIADLGRNFALRVVAEGVEHEPELALLAAMGCDFAQGFVISRPLEPAAFEDWLTHYRPQLSAPTDVGESQFATTEPSVPKQWTSGLGERLRLVAQGIASEGPLEMTLQRLMGELSAVLGAKFAACWISNPEARQLEPLAMWSVSAPGEPSPLIAASQHVRYAPGRGLPGTALAADALVRSVNLDHDPHFLLSAAARQAGCSAAVAVPLRSNNKPVGVLEFLGAGPLPSSATIDAALQHVGSLVGEFIAARQAEQETIGVTRILASLTGAITRLSTARPGEIARQLCLDIQELANAHAVLLWQPRCDERALTVSASCGVRVDPVQVSLTDEHSGAAAAFHARRAIFISDVAHHALPSKRLAAATQAASALYQPICTADASVGVLAIAWKQQQADVPQALQSAIEALARSAAPLLARARIPPRVVEPPLVRS